MARKKSLLVMLRPQLILIGAIILGVGIFALCYNAGGVNMLSDNLPRRIRSQRKAHCRTSPPPFPIRHSPQKRQSLQQRAG